MKSPASDDGIMLSFFCKDPESTTREDCAAFHRTDRGSWMVQGDRHDGPEVRAQLRAPKDSEGAVEISDGLADLFVRMFAKERYGVDLGSAAQ